LILNQHGVCDTFARGFALSYNQDAGFPNFGKEEDKVWTMIDGKIVETWYMCCPAIPDARCTGNAKQPSWVSSYSLPQSAQKPPLVKPIEYPSYIYTPNNIKSPIGWSYRAVLRKRGLWSGEECFNEDLVKPLKNVTNFDLRKLEKREEKNESPQNQKKLLSLENINFEGEKKEIDSPRSLQACEELGILPEELFHVNFEDFVKSHPEMVNLSKSVLNLRLIILKHIDVN